MQNTNDTKWTADMIDQAMHKLADAAGMVVLGSTDAHLYKQRVRVMVEQLFALPDGQLDALDPIDGVGGDHWDAVAQLVATQLSTGDISEMDAVGLIGTIFNEGDLWPVEDGEMSSWELVCKIREVL